MISLLAWKPPLAASSYHTAPLGLIGGTFAGTVLTLAFLPALYAIWFKIRPATEDGQALAALQTEAVTAVGT